MKWFSGDIRSAIQTAKEKSAIFIVFVAREDDKSRQMETYLHSEEVTKVCEDNQCVAVRIEAQTNDCKLFSQIYPLVVIPVTFFIGTTGIPLEVIGECESKEDFLSKVQKAITLHKSSSVPDDAATSSAVAAPQEASATPSEEIADGARGGLSLDESQVQEGSSEDRLHSEGSNGDGNPEETQAALDAKVDRAKKLLEEKRNEKLRKEAEDQRRKELERRNVGQGVQKLRQQQKDQEVLEAKRELKKDREEDKLARQRVKEEIERDRAEKASRFNREKNERALAAEEAKKKKLLEQQAAQAAEQARRSDIARIQFRLPDGSSIAQQFSATDTFASVHEFITGHMGTAVNLSMAFPRRTFTSEDQKLTLQELQLAPSAVILVLPKGRSDGQVRSSSGGLSVSSVVSLVFSPFYFLWNIVASIFGLGVTPDSSNSPSPPRGRQTAAAATGGDRDRGGAVKRPASSSRQEGPIRRFRNADDDVDDDERNTWNGNSTQQM